MDFKSQLLQRKGRVEDNLSIYFKDKSGFQKLLIEAMEYSINAGGKRLRPILLLEVCEMLGGNIDDALPFASAIEMIHTYSLIHDDLPAMDNDDYRRGKPTNHRVYGEGVAILAGDGLLNLAFEIMLEKIYINPQLYERGIKAMHVISRASGVNGMIGGQVVDLESEGKKVNKELLNFIHLNKTSAMIEASIKAGAIIGRAGKREYRDLENYGKTVGLAFQIIDDILDVVGDETKLGKKIGSDVHNGKSTYPSLYGIEESKKIAFNLLERSMTSLDGFGKEADFLRELVEFLKVREY